MDITTVPVALLAGGPATGPFPEALVEVAGRPFIDHQLDLLRRAGVRRVVLCLGALGERVQEHLGDGRAHGLGLHCSHDGPRALGTAGALRRAAPLLGGLFWVLHGNAYPEVDYRGLLAALPPRPALGLMAVRRRPGGGNAVFRGGRVLRYDRRRRSADMEHADQGLALLRATVLEFVPPDRRWDLAELYADMADRGQLAGYELSEPCHEIGSPAGLAETRAHLERRAA